MQFARFVLALLLVGLLALTGFVTSGQDSLLVVRALHSRDPAMWELFLETYAGVVLVSLWMIARERRTSVALAWLTFFFLFGHVATISYVLIALAGSNVLRPETASHADPVSTESEVEAAAPVTNPDALKV